MAKMKYWNGTTWKILDAKDADAVDGKHFIDIQNDAQTKADKAEQNAKSYTDEQITLVLSDIETSMSNVETEIAALNDRLGTSEQNLTSHLADFANVQNKTGVLSNLVTSAKTTLVHAINETYNRTTTLFDQLSTQIGTLSSLTTSSKTNLVSAINETYNRITTLFDQLSQALNAHQAKTASMNDIGHVYAAEFTTTLSTSWSGSAAPYTQTVTINGITSAHNPIIDVVMSGTYSTDQQRIEQWGYIYRAVTGTNQITFYASEKPTVSLPIRVKVVM